MNKEETLKTLEIRGSRWGYAIFRDGIKLTPYQRDRVYVEAIRDRLAWTFSDEAQDWARSVLGEAE